MTDFSRTDPIEAKNNNDRGQRHNFSKNYGGQIFFYFLARKCLAKDKNDQGQGHNFSKNYMVGKFSLIFLRERV